MKPMVTTIMVNSIIRIKIINITTGTTIEAEQLEEDKAIITTTMIITGSHSSNLNIMVISKAFSIIGIE